jgi:hypothetical protein
MAGIAVDISVYDITGRRVKRSRRCPSSGRHDVAWDGRDASGLRVRRGMYFIHIRIGKPGAAGARHLRRTETPASRPAAWDEGPSRGPRRISGPAWSQRALMG